MISHLLGKIINKNEKFVIVDVGGVGYQVFCNSRLLDKVAEGENAGIFTHLHVREDEMSLYGFFDKYELDFFRLLIGISGIGPKGALGVLAIASIEELQEAIITENEAILTRVSGIGKKVAQKIILELKPKIKDMPIKVRPQASDDLDALEALVGMGYGSKEAREVLRQISPAVKSVENKVREALKLLGK